MTDVIIISAVLAAGVLVFLFLGRSILKNAAGEIARSIDQKNKELFNEERERLLEQYRAEKEILEAKLKSGERFLEGKKDVIKEMVEKIHQEMTRHQARLSETERERVGEFSRLKAVLDEYKIITGGLKESADNLKNLLSNNQLRGKYGEEVAERLLNTVGFVKGQNYVANVEQDTVATRPDFTMFLPDGVKINIDAKFPLQALIKYQEVEDKLEKERFLREFASDVRQKVKQVAGRDYINQEENTVDFAILFVPNEMIFSFIYDQLGEIWDEAMKKKVILAGPFSFTAILRMVFQSYKNFKYQQELYSIIKLIRAFEQEYEKFSEELDKLGTRIQSVEAQYQTVSLTRTKKLTGIIEKIRREDVLPEGEDKKKLPESRTDDF